MKRVAKLLFACFCALSLCCRVGLAQSGSDTLLAKDNTVIPLPTVNLNLGFNHAFADVALSKDGPTPFRQLGYQLTIVQRAAKFLNVGFELYTGTIYGEEQRESVNLNYRTSLVSPRVTLEYNFHPLIKPDAKGRQLVRPYIGFGLGGLFFRSKGDLKNENGLEYQYWSDGFIYAEQEGTVDVSEATQLTRDFEYETDLRDANLDGLRKYSQTTFSMPINAGIRFQLSKNFGVNAAFSYVLNITDMIDNVSPESVGVRQGESGFDNHLFGSIGLSVFLGTTKPSAKPKPRFEEQVVFDTSSENSATKEVIAKEKTEKWDELAAVSDLLIEASEGMQKTAENSEKSIKENSELLTSIANKDIQSGKNLKAAKKESILLIENSISTLNETTSALNETSGKVNSVATDLNSQDLGNQLTSTEKIRKTIEETVPAMQELKDKIASAKSPEELKSILNITSRNLAHTKDIFSDESAQINASIVVARKTVAEARTNELVAGEISSKDQRESIIAELDDLLAQGVLDKPEYMELKTALATSEVKLNQNQSVKQSEDNLETASQLLKNALVTLNSANEQAEESLIEHRNELNSVAESNIESKKELKTAKEEALKVVDEALADFTQTESSISDAESDLERANMNIGESESGKRLTNVARMSNSISKTVDLLKASRTEIKSSKNAEQLKSVIQIASTNLSKTRDVISKESASASKTIDNIRKNLIVNEIELVQASTTETESLKQLNQKGTETLENQLDKLLKDGLIDQQEYNQMQQSIDLASTGTTGIEMTENRSSEVNPSTRESQSGLSEMEESESSAAESTTKTAKPNTGFDIKSIEESEPKKTGDYHWADLNKNSWISPDEVLHFIDLLFEGESKRSVGDIQNLIDYYFDQE